MSEESSGTSPGDGAARTAGDQEPAPWRAVAPRGVPGTYAVPEVALTRLLDDAANDFPSGTAVWYRGRRLTWRQLQDQADRLAAALDGAGVRPGDRLLFGLPGGPQAVVCLFGAWRLGAAVAPVDPGLADGELAEAARSAGATTAVVPDRSGARPELSGTVPRVFVTGPEDALPFPRNVAAMVRRRAGRPARRAPADQPRLMAQVRSHGPLAPEDTPSVDGDSAAAVFPSPDGVVVHTHRELLHAAFHLRLWLPDTVAGGERILATVPLHKPLGVTTAVTMPVLSAATMLPAAGASTRRLARVVARRDPTVVVLDERDAASLLDDLATPSLRVCLQPGPCDPQRRTRTEQATGARVRGWWAPPVSAGVVLADPVYGLTKPGTVGIPVTDTVVRVGAPGSSRALIDEPGPLWIRGPQLPGGGWRDSGARAVMDPDGFVTIRTEA